MYNQTKIFRSTIRVTLIYKKLSNYTVDLISNIMKIRENMFTYGNTEFYAYHEPPKVLDK